MTTRKSVLGLSLFCALLVCAFTAVSASANAPEKEGTTLFTCKKGQTGFSDEHCTPAGAGGTAFGHVLSPIGTKTEVTGSNEKTKNTTKEATPAVLTSIVGGVEVEIVCAKVTSTGEVVNEEMATEEKRHTIVDSNGVMIYSGCTVPKPAGQECKIKEGKITTNPLKSISEGMARIITPTTGTSFVTITIEGCKAA